jgi:acetyltransferase-like isoleucine patch superfamily enzyme
MMDIWRQELGGFNARVLLARLLLSPLPDRVGPRVRAIVLRILGFRIGRGVLFLDLPTFSGPAGLHRRLHIGHGCFFNTGCHLELGADIEISSSVAFGHEVLVLTTTHAASHPERRCGASYSRPVRIGRGAWLGSRSLVLPGVTIGEGAVVGAGALVSKDVPPHAVVAGVPARVIRLLESSAIEPDALHAGATGRS